MDMIVDNAASVARKVAEGVSEGVNCLYAIVVEDDRSEVAALSQMRSALVLILSGVQLETHKVPVDDETIEHLDRVIDSLGGAGDRAASREMARVYLAELNKKWGPLFPLADSK